MSNVRSITPDDQANFTPELGNYKTLQPFRCWCQKVLPLVYDDSLSYYELLCKVVQYLNKTIENVKLVGEDMTKLYDTYKKLENYVNTYFDNIDIQSEVNSKLDMMSKDGTLSEIINEYLFAELEAKINDMETKFDNLIWLKNKKVCVYGDSIVANNVRNYLTILNENYGLNITNRAIGGTCLNNRYENSGVDLIRSATDLNTFDIILLAYGTNDWTTSAPIDHENNTTNFKTACKTVIEHISDNAPNSQVVFITPFYSYKQFTAYNEENVNYRGHCLYDYVKCAIEVCASYGVSVIDFYTKSSCNKHNYTSKLNNSGGTYVHPNTEFYIELAQLVSDYCCTTLTNVNHYANKNYLTVFDFYEQTKRVELTEFEKAFSGKYKYGKTLKLNGNEVATGVCKHTVTNGLKYLISGITSKSITINIGEFQLNVAPGRFYCEFVCTSTSVVNIKITNMVNEICYIGSLYFGAIEELTDGFNTYGVWGKLAPYENVSMGIDGQYKCVDDMLMINMYTFTAEQTIARNTHLNLIPCVNVGTDTLWLQCIVSGSYQPLYITGTDIMSYYEIPQGTTVIVPNQCIPVSPTKYCIF